MFVSFLNKGWPWNLSLSTGYAFLGMICIGLAFWPGFYNTWKTKDTQFLPIGLFSLFLLTGVLMTSGSISGIWKTPEANAFYVRGWIFVLLNVFVTSTNIYTVGLWCKNKFLGRRRADSSYADVSDTSGIDEEQEESEEYEYNEGVETEENSNLADLGLAI